MTPNQRWPEPSPESIAGTPSDWVLRFAHLLKARKPARVLDLACGAGRHARYFASLGHQVWAVDRNPAALQTLAGVAGIRTLTADLETEVWPLAELSGFDALVVTHYLHRPHFLRLPDLLAEGGIFIYETFAQGQASFGKPSRPDFLLRPGELLEGVRGRLQVLAYEDGLINQPHLASIQRICAVKLAAQDVSERYPLFPLV